MRGGIHHNDLIVWVGTKTQRTGPMLFDIMMVRPRSWIRAELMPTPNLFLRKSLGNPRMRSWPMG